MVIHKIMTYDFYCTYKICYFLVYGFNGLFKKLTIFKFLNGNRFLSLTHQELL